MKEEGRGGTMEGEERAPVEDGQMRWSLVLVGVEEENQEEPPPPLFSCHPTTDNNHHP